jgi:hypothetical protein
MSPSFERHSADLDASCSYERLDAPTDLVARAPSLVLVARALAHVVQAEDVVVDDALDEVEDSPADY